MQIDYKNTIIIALDVKDIDTARALVHSLQGVACFYKIGMELLARPDALSFVIELKKQGYRVFLDAKLYDIGRTVEAAVVNYVRLGVDFLTIHAEHNTIKAAVNAARKSTLKLLAVTVMTNMNNDDLRRMGIENSTVEQLVCQRAAQSYELGAHGVISSAYEVSMIRKQCADDFLICTPGIRPKGRDNDDQKRVVTPYEAFQNGANYIVIGRAITQAKDPRECLQSIVKDLNEQRAKNG